MYIITHLNHILCRKDGKITFLNTDNIIEKIQFASTKEAFDFMNRHCLSTKNLRVEKYVIKKKT